MTKNLSLVERLSQHPEIRARECQDGITAYNFSKRAFWDGIWDETTVNARGLFMRGNTIVGRGYNKFFNLGQHPGFTRDEVLSDFVFPVTVSDKMNGYLAVAFADKTENGNVLKVFSKSGDGTEFSNEAYRVVTESVERLSWMTEFLAENNLSATFEIISDHDKHIIDEGRERAVLLDFIYNTEDFQTMDKSQMVAHATLFGVEYAPYVVLESKNELEEAIDAGHNATNEGVVMRDAEGRMTKIKSERYLRIKSVRGGLMRMLSGKEPRKVNEHLQHLMDQGVMDKLHLYVVTNLMGSQDIDLPRLAKDFNL